MGRGHDIRANKAGYFVPVEESPRFTWNWVFGLSAKNESAIEFRRWNFLGFFILLFGVSWFGWFAFTGEQEAFKPFVGMVVVSSVYGAWIWCKLSSYIEPDEK